MSNFYVHPDWIPDSQREYESPYYRAPIPLPGVHSFPRGTNSAAFRSESIDFPQYQLIGAFGFPKSNICGSLAYRRRDVRAKYITSTSGGSQYGIPFGTTTGASKTWSAEYDYIIRDERDEDYIDPETGDHEQRWKDVIITDRTVNEYPDGDPIPMPPTYRMGPDRAEHRYIKVTSHPDGSVTQSRENAGETTFTFLIDHAYYESRLALWENLASSARRRTHTLGYYGTTVATSDSKEGIYSYIVGGQWYATVKLSEDIPDDDDRYFAHGWPLAVYVNVPQLQRRNAPVLRDSKHPENNTIFNKSRTEAILGNEITVHRWLDDCGAYDPVGEQRFRNCGWKPLNIEDLANELVAVRPESQGGTSQGRMVVADGVSTYRVTLIVRGYHTGETDLSDLKTVTFLVTPDSGDFDLRLADGNTDWATGVIVSKLEKKVIEDGEEKWNEITVQPRTIASMPDTGVLLLCMGRSRKGKRWGFPQYDTTHWPAQAAELGAEYSTEMRYFASQLFRHIGKATTES